MNNLLKKISRSDSVHFLINKRFICPFYEKIIVVHAVFDTGLGYYRIVTSSGWDAHHKNIDFIDSYGFTISRLAKLNGRSLSNIWYERRNSLNIKDNYIRYLYP